MAISRRSVLGLGAAIAVALPGKMAFANQPPLRVKFALNRGPFDASNVPFILADRKGYFTQENLLVEFSLSKDASDCLHRVASNEFDFGFLDFSVLLRFALETPQDTPLYVFTVFDRSPSCVVTWKSSGVKKPSDLIGRRLAAVTTDGAFELFPSFLRAAGLDPASIKLNMVSLAEREKAMLSRTVDGTIGFDSTIFYKLQNVGVAPNDVDFTYYADGGLNLYSNGIVVSRKMIGTNPTQIAGVIRACAKGWRDALQNPEEAMNVMSDIAPAFNRVQETSRFDWIKTRQILTPDALKNGMGEVNRSRLDSIIKQIETPETARSGLPADNVYSPDYLPARSDRTVEL
jgi:NitT/TauT family transport system substrate-binding protein